MTLESNITLQQIPDHLLGLISQSETALASFDEHYRRASRGDGPPAMTLSDLVLDYVAHTEHHLRQLISGGD